MKENSSGGFLSPMLFGDRKMSVGTVPDTFRGQEDAPPEQLR